MKTLALTLLLIAPPAFANRLPSYWSVDYLLTHNNGDVTALRSRDNRTILTYISVKKLRGIARVMDDIQSVSEVSARLYIEPGPANAFAGKINGRTVVIVSTGMLEVVGYDFSEYAAVLGHEVAHIKLHHPVKRIVSGYAEQAVAKAVRKESTWEQVVAKLLTKSIATTFTRKQESNCDYLGAIWATEAGYDPYGASRLWRKMVKLSGEHLFPFLQVHPPTESRIRAMTDLAKRLDTRKPSS